MAPAAALPGVKVGPLDPEATREFGQVAGHNSARTLIRLHRQMYPPQLKRALARPLQEGHSKAVLEDLDGTVADYIRGLSHDNGDPVVPEDCEIVGANVRGDRATGMVLTFQYQLPSGRVGKWFAPYTPEALPEVHDVGLNYSRRRQMRDQGLVAFDEEAAGQELYRRQLAQANAEIKRLRSAQESGGSTDGIPKAENDVSSSNQLAEERERLGRENQELRERLARLESLVSSGQGGVPTGGLEEDIARSTGGSAPAQGSSEQVAAQDPPFEDYDDLTANQLIDRLKAEETSNDERRAVLEYERTHNNRKSVVNCAEGLLA